MAMLNRVQVGLRAIGVKVTIPENPTAKLMYYLDSMCTVLKLDDNADINRLRRYQTYSTLNHTDRNVLLHLCMLLNPEILLNKCIFQNDAMCPNSGNEFYDLEQVRHTFFVAGSVMIGGQRRQVNKIMTFKMSWLRNNWTNPMQRLSASQQAERRQMMMEPQIGQSCTIL